LGNDFASTINIISLAGARARHAVLLASLCLFAGFAGLPIARAQDPGPPVQPAISEDAGAALSAMRKTLSAPTLSFTARTMRVYLDEAGQPLHVFHTLKVVVRVPDRLKVQETGDDGSNELYYDGNSVSIFSPDRDEYAGIAAPGGIELALNEVVSKLKIDFPLVSFFAVSPERSLLRGVVAGWQVGTANIDGVECRHLLFLKRGGTDLELWVEKNDSAIPRRLIVTHRLLPGQPDFVAELTNWDSRVRPPDSEFVFRAPSTAKQIQLIPAAAPGQPGRS
jgi:hypothetical protein